VRWLADENLNNDIIPSLRRRKPDLDIVRAQDAGLTGLEDPALLAWAAAEDRILITHDVSTMTAFAYRRMAEGQYLPGVLQVSRSVCS
jgi:predicted nuclease of predicted toxin-antitoxin system